MREKVIEQKFREAVRQKGGLALKFRLPDLTECRTDWYFCRKGKLPL